MGRDGVRRRRKPDRRSSLRRQLSVNINLNISDNLIEVFLDHNSSRCRGQSSFSSRESERSARMRPLGLAARAVVGLVVGVANALDRGTALGARFAESAVDGHSSRNAVTLLGKPSPVSALRRSIHSARTLRVARQSVRRQLGVNFCVERQWRQPRAMKDLVGIGVADTAEEPRIRERTFECVILAAQDAFELAERRRERLEAARVLSAQSVLLREKRGVTPGAYFRPR